MRAALAWNCGSRGNIQQRCCQGRIASSCGHRSTVTSGRASRVRHGSSRRPIHGGARRAHRGATSSAGSSAALHGWVCWSVRPTRWRRAAGTTMRRRQRWRYADEGSCLSLCRGRSLPAWQRKTPGCPPGVFGYSGRQSSGDVVHDSYRCRGHCVVSRAEPTTRLPGRRAWLRVPSSA